MRLTIAVLTYQGAALLPACLTSLNHQRRPFASVDFLVLDNGSTPAASPQDVHAEQGVRLVRREYNLGNIGGMDACFQEALGEWVLFLANDVRLQEDCLVHLWESRRWNGVVQPVLYQPDGHIDNVGLTWHWPGYGRRVRQLGKPPHTTQAFAATCFLMRRELYHTIGGFDTRLGISHEDIDFSLRLRALGGTTGYVPTARATHLMGQTIGRVEGARSLAPDYHQARMRVLTKHYPGWRGHLRRRVVTLLDGLAGYRRPR